MKKILSFALMATVLIGCTHTRYHDITSFVVEYWPVGAIELKEVNDTTLGVYYKVDFTEGQLRIVGATSKGDQKVAFDSLCSKHGDTSFQQEICTQLYGGDNWGVAGNYYSTYTFDVCSINIVSDADFDEQHMAGTSLNDVITFISVSTMPYISSGYAKRMYIKKGTSDLEYFDLFKVYTVGPGAKTWVDSETMVTPFHIIKTPLDQVTLDQLQLLGVQNNNYNCVMALRFESRPTLNSEHHFTITIKADNGQVFTATSTMTFSE